MKALPFWIVMRARTEADWIPAAVDVGLKALPSPPLPSRTSTMPTERRALTRARSRDSKMLLLSLAQQLCIVQVSHDLETLRYWRGDLCA